MTQLQLDTVRTYLQHLHNSETAGLIATFEHDGLVHSPFLGTMKARDVFPKLAQASSLRGDAERSPRAGAVAAGRAWV